MHFIKDILKGMVIGIANAIPGVSGGTMMVSMGIYDKIISSVTGIFKHFKKSVLTLLPYGIGMAVGIVALSFVITSMFDNFPLQTALLFIGLILGGLPIIFKHVKGTTIRVPHIMVFIIFFSVIIALQLLGGDGGKDVTLSMQPLMIISLLLVGLIASATMVIPGVSGSMMLMLLGFYTPIMESIKNTVTYLKEGDIGNVITTCFPLIPFGIGVVLGIYFVAKLIELLLKKYEALTYCGILGLVVASPVVVILSTIGEAKNPISLNPGTIISGIVLLAVGLVIAYFLGNEDEEAA